MGGDCLKKKKKKVSKCSGCCVFKQTAKSFDRWFHCISGYFISGVFNCHVPTSAEPRQSPRGRICIQLLQRLPAAWPPSITRMSLPNAKSFILFFYVYLLPRQRFCPQSPSVFGLRYLNTRKKKKTHAHRYTRRSLTHTNAHTHTRMPHLHRTWAARQAYTCWRICDCNQINWFVSLWKRHTSDAEQKKKRPLVASS